MNKYAVIRLAGKQLKVSEGETFEVTRQEELNIEVLLYSDGKDVVIGTPVLSDVFVNAEIKEQKMGNKIDVSRYRAKSRYRKRKGHRQPLTILEIKSISKGKPKVAEVTTTESVEKKAKEPIKKVTKPIKESTKPVVKDEKPIKTTKAVKPVKKIQKKKEEK